MVKMDPNNMNPQHDRYYPHPPPPSSGGDNAVGYGSLHGGGPHPPPAPGGEGAYHHLHPNQGNPPKLPPHYGRGVGGGPRYAPYAHHPPVLPPAPESRYPPSSAPRGHVDHSRHPPPPSSSYVPRAQQQQPGAAAVPSLPHPADRFGKTITVSSRVTIRDDDRDYDTNRDEDFDRHHHHHDDDDDQPRSLPQTGSSAFLPYSGPPPHRSPPTAAGGGGKTKVPIVDDGGSDGASDDEIKAANSKPSSGDDDAEGGERADADVEESRDDNNNDDDDDDDAAKSPSEEGEGGTGRDRPVVFAAVVGAPGEARVGGNDEDDVARRIKKPQPISTTRSMEIHATTTTLKRTRSALYDGSEDAMAHVDDMTPKHINISRHTSSQQWPSSEGGGIGRRGDAPHHRDDSFVVDDGYKRSRPYNDYVHVGGDYDDRGGHDRGRGGEGGEGGYGGYDYPPPSPHDDKSYSSLEYDEENRQDRPTTSSGGGGNKSATSAGRYPHQGRSQPYDREYCYQDLHDRGGGGGGGGRIKSSWTTPGDGNGSNAASSAAPGLDYANSHEYAGNGSIGPSSLLNYSQSLSWEVPAGTLSGIESSLTFEREQAAGGRGAAAAPCDGGVSNGKGETATATTEDNDIPPLTSTGSNHSHLPPRKRTVLLAHRPSAASSSGELLHPPRTTVSATSCDGSDEEQQKHDRTIEPRDVPPDSSSSRYAPTTVHYPVGRLNQPHQPMQHHRQPEYLQQHPQQHHPHHPSQVRSYDQHYYNRQHPPPQHPLPSYYQHDQQRYDYDSRYEPPRGDFPGVSGAYHAGGGGSGGEPRHDRHSYESPGRYHPYPNPEYSTGANTMGGPGGAPWGAPPHTSSNPRHQRPHHYDNNLPLQPYHGHHYPNDNGPPPPRNGTSGRHDDGYASDSRSFDSTLSKKSFRSLEDLEEPMQSLLYRPSFSWERGLDVPAGGGNPPSSATGLPPLSSSRGGGRANIIPLQLSQQQKIMKSLTMRNEIRTIGNLDGSVELILLLAMPQDRHCLSETLCIVRNNVEVFTATENDINAPAPGRKRPIQIGQVGLRCVYCRMCHQRDRVKRATCFPSSMKRIYRAVIDMKLDHFKNCPYVPTGLKARLDQLQAGSTRSTGMTVQYFVKSARELGMSDSMDDGVLIDLRSVGSTRIAEPDYGCTPPPSHGMRLVGDVVAGSVDDAMEPYNAHPYNGNEFHQFKKPKQKKTSPSHVAPQGATSHGDVCMIAPPQAGNSLDTTSDPKIPDKRFSGKVLLALPEDKNFLSPLRCFLRENVCAFTASPHDIAVRTPTTFSVRVGQVGVGCVHCLAVSPKSRSNRAVCFPFAMARIYQSVADIQRFHLGECRMMPPSVRTEFLRLQSESAKGSRGLATRMYWIDSAKMIGLTDGPAGMYFCRDPSLLPLSSDTISSVEQLDILAHASGNNDLASRSQALVAPEDKPTIAEFLYLVMEQLRPCRFTDADRNKRRSKNVGCVGVECKHCAGKIDGRKFFWSSVSAAESNFVSVHSHMLTCKYIPEHLKDELTILKTLRREQTSLLKTGSQKAFFIRVWARLHGEPVPPPPSHEDAKKLASRGKVITSSKKIYSLGVAPSHAVMSEMFIDASMTTGYGSTISKEDAGSLSPEVPILRTRCSNDSDDLRALLESKSTLSSLPSVDESVIKNSIQDTEGSEIVPVGRSDESAANIYTTSSKSSMNSVALNLSAVTMHCKEEEEKEQQQQRWSSNE